MCVYNGSKPTELKNKLIETSKTPAPT